VPTAYDLVVIGGGAAGLGAARARAAAGGRTLLVSKDEIGGECTFTGCVPSKTPIEAAARGASFPDAMAAVRRAVRTIAATETAEVLAREGIEVLRCGAVFTSPRDASAGGRMLRPRGFVIATGSRPAVPPVPGLAEADYLTNETIFGPDELPGRLAVLGGGGVGCELHRNWARASTNSSPCHGDPSALTRGRTAAPCTTQPRGPRRSPYHVAGHPRSRARSKRRSAVNIRWSSSPLEARRTIAPNLSCGGAVTPNRCLSSRDKRQLSRGPVHDDPQEVR